MPDEHTIPVPMTEVEILRKGLGRVAEVHPFTWAESARRIAIRALADAAVARPAEPELTVRWCETHEAPIGETCNRLGGYRCRVTTRSVGGVVGGDA